VRSDERSQRLIVEICCTASASLQIPSSKLDVDHPTLVSYSVAILTDRSFGVG
jgi:hypothetical protein